MKIKELIELIKKNKNIIISTLVIIIIVLVVLIKVTGIKNNNILKEDKTQKKVEIKHNKNENVLKEQIVDGIKISDVKVEIIDGLTTFTAKATNTTESPINFKGVDILVKGEKEYSLAVYGFESINPGETLDLINYSDVDLEKAEEVTYSIVYQ